MNGRHRNSGMDWIRRSTRMAIYCRDDNRCLHCRTEHRLTLHHVRGNAGGNGPDNLVTLCQACNQAEEKDPCGPCPRCVVAMVSPLDRKEGLRLAKARWPERYAQERERLALKRGMTEDERAAHVADAGDRFMAKNADLMKRLADG